MEGSLAHSEGPGERMGRAVRGHREEQHDSATSHGLLHCYRDMWRGRQCFRLGNGLLELVVLTGGGHIAQLRLKRPPGRPSISPLWVPPWKTIEPYAYRTTRHTARFGSITEGKLLCGLSGHNLCLDYFGSPSPEEAQQGLSQHGEAPSLRWRKISQSIADDRLELVLSVRLPAAGLRFRRRITLRRDQPVVYFRETVGNERKCDHFFHWTQHVTLGPPFISKRESTVSLSGIRGITFPFGYDEGKSLLASGKEFRWPFAPARSGGSVNLERVLIREGLGFVASVLIDPRRGWGYVSALSTKHRLLIAYCFRRKDFPWVAIWEENRAISAVPWQSRTEARGLEFGTTPIPSTRSDTFRRGRLFGTDTLACVPARKQKTVEYLAFLAEVPASVRRIHDIRYSGKEIVVNSDAREVLARIPASFSR